MPKSKFGSKKHQGYGRGQQIESLPERKILTFRDFRRGYTPSEQRQMVDPAASPVTHDMEIREDNRLWRAAGTEVLDAFAQRLPSRLALHPGLNETVQLVLVDPPRIGFRLAEDDKEAEWYDLGMEDRQSFASTTFGGSFIFSDGIRVWVRSAHGAPPELLESAPAAASYASFAGRVFAGRTLIDGRWEPLGIRWSAADSNYKNWDGFGSGFELLVNDVSTGDRIQKLEPMNLDLMAVPMRRSIWVGRFTGNPLRPVDFRPQVPGVGAVNGRVIRLSRFGVIMLSDNGVYIFDGNTATLISQDINGELLPLDYSRLEDYHAVYDPMRKRYILYTPQDKTWVLEIEKERWLKRSFSALDATMFPSQVDAIRWFEILGNWLDQGEIRWVDLAGENTGELRLMMLGDQEDVEGTLRRVLARESRTWQSYFGIPFIPYWETRTYDEQDASNLVTSKKQLVEYEGEGCLRIYLPNNDNQYERILQTFLELRDYPSTAVFNASKTGKGTGIGIEFCEEPGEELPVPPDEFDYDYDADYDANGEEAAAAILADFEGYAIFSDVHISTQVDGAHQQAPLQVACAVLCNEFVCGGPGGFLIWYSNDPEELEQGCSHPNNPIPGLLL